MSYATHLHPDMFKKSCPSEPIRSGFGKALAEAGGMDERIVALCADLTDSTKMNAFRDAYPDRFIEIGIAEQNLASVSAGLAIAGRIPFSSSYAAFHPGRSFDQIRTSICMGELPVKIVGSHAGVSVGPDGGTHQMLEDIALMRVLPNMVVVCPGDALEAHKATMALAGDDERPAYLRLAREATPVFTTEKSPFDLDRAQILRKGKDVTLAGTGTMTYQLLVAAEELAKKNIDAEVIHVPVVKPLDSATLLASSKRTGKVVTAEEAQIAGGFGSLVSELMSEHNPVPVLRIGVDDKFGQSGTPDELLKHFGLTGTQMAKKIASFIAN